MIVVGFTGTRDGMTTQQEGSVAEILAEFANPDGCELHHGDCVGSDAGAVRLARGADYHIVCHPPTDERLRAFTPSDLVLPAKSYLARNYAIVHACSVLVATPKEAVEQVRSGTWATVRYARRLRRPTILVLPSGVVERHAY